MNVSHSMSSTPRTITIPQNVKTCKRTQGVGVVNASNLITWMFLFLKKTKMDFRKKNFLIHPFLLVPIISLVPMGRWNPPVASLATWGVIPSALNEVHYPINMQFVEWSHFYQPHIVPSALQSLRIKLKGSIHTFPVFPILDYWMAKLSCDLCRSNFTSNTC